MIELKRCPFCGGEADVYTTEANFIPKTGKAFCYCKKCRSCGESFEDTEHNGKFVFKAIKAWNKRAGND